MKKIVFFLIVLIAAIIVYLFIGYLRNKKECPPLLNDIMVGTPYGNISKKGERTITQEEMVEGIELPDYKLGMTIPPLNGSKKMSLHMWIKPENQTDNFQNDNNSLQHILEWGQNVYIMYEPVRNEIVIRVNVIVSPTQHQQEFRLTNCIGIQKWNMLTFVFDNRYLDVYVNGRLFRSILIYNVPIFDEGTWFLCRERGFIGKITAIRYFNYSLTDKEVETLYNKTNGNPPSNGMWWLWRRKPLVRLITN